MYYGSRGTAGFEEDFLTGMGALGAVKKTRAEKQAAKQEKKDDRQEKACKAKGWHWDVGRSACVQPRPAGVIGSAVSSTQRPPTPAQSCASKRGVWSEERQICYGSQAELTCVLQGGIWDQRKSAAKRCILTAAPAPVPTPTPTPVPATKKEKLQAACEARGGTWDATKRAAKRCVIGGAAPTPSPIPSGLTAKQAAKLAAQQAKLDAKLAQQAAKLALQKARQEGKLAMQTARIEGKTSLQQQRLEAQLAQQKQKLMMQSAKQCTKQGGTWDFAAGSCTRPTPSYGEGGGVVIPPEPGAPQPEPEQPPSGEYPGYQMPDVTPPEPGYVAPAPTYTAPSYTAPAGGGGGGGGAPLIEPVDTGAITPEGFAPGAAPGAAAAPAVAGECDPAFAAQLPMEYADQFGTMKVLAVYCGLKSSSSLPTDMPTSPTQSVAQVEAGAVEEQGFVY